MFAARYVRTLLYLGSVAIVMMVVGMQIAWVAGLLAIAGLVLVATLLALVNSQHDELVAEIRRLQVLLDKERREP